MNDLIKRIRERILARLRFIGTQLNAIQALLLAAIVANPGQLEAAIKALVPETYRPVAGLLAGVVAFVIVHAASNSDAKKVAANAGR